jgi:hypothetical protein
VDAGGILLANQWLGAQELVELGAALGVVAALEDQDGEDR